MRQLRLCTLYECMSLCVDAMSVWMQWRRGAWLCLALLGCKLTTCIVQVRVQAQCHTRSPLPTAAHPPTPPQPVLLDVIDGWHFYRFDLAIVCGKQVRGGCGGLGIEG